jgi:hypothetical protein
LATFTIVKNVILNAIFQQNFYITVSIISDCLNWSDVEFIIVRLTTFTSFVEQNLQICLTQGQIDKVAMSASSTGYQLNEVRQLVPAVTIRNQQLTNDVTTRQTSIYDEQLSIRYFDEVSIF